MPKTKMSEEEVKRRKRAHQWKLFRRNNFLTQRRLAEVLGICRRTVQMVEGAHIDPRDETLRRFAIFRRKYNHTADLESQLGRST